ncbi:hypothetical protein Dip518_001280 [Parelusimicrobium proximum]|uniref:hypothetical protein n=1 Tax=Parelusimicrobium proximum TaxID=3228953 RepID=UPI003D16C2AA
MKKILLGSTLVIMCATCGLAQMWESAQHVKNLGWLKDNTTQVASNTAPGNMENILVTLNNQNAKFPMLYNKNTKSVTPVMQDLLDRVAAGKVSEETAQNIIVKNYIYTEDLETASALVEAFDSILTDEKAKEQVTSSLKTALKKESDKKQKAAAQKNQPKKKSWFIEMMCAYGKMRAGMGPIHP